MEEKEAYRKLCERDPSIPIFLSYEWIAGFSRDADWGVRFAGDPRNPKAFFVFFIKRKYGFKRLLMPPLTPFLGPWIFYPEGQKRSSVISYEEKVCQELIEQLPPYDELIMDFHPSFRNWLPFYWNGFAQSTHYTYRIEDPSDLDRVFAALKGNIRRALQKGKRQLEVRSDDPVDELYKLVSSEFRRKGIPLHFERTDLERIDRNLAASGKRKILYAYDDKGRLHAGIYLVLDSSTCYYLIGAGDRSIMQNGAMSLLIWEGIRLASELGLAFDLEGSMVSSVERFFRSFGAAQFPYHHIEHRPSLILRGRNAIQQFLCSSPGDL